MQWIIQSHFQACFFGMLAAKTLALKPKTTRKITDASTRTAAEKEPPIPKQKRVFGTIRSTNIHVKTATENPITKQPKSITIRGNPSINVTTDQVAKKPERFKKKVQKPEKRFDKLETASCWLGQIKLAESVGKHFVPIALIRLPSIPMLAESVGKHLVSVAFFRLAFDSNPIRNLRAELKRYMGRHGYLSYEAEWKEVSRSYGILKDESNVGGESLELGKGKTTCR
ncbi:hypothetical protein POPTR_016G129250v4 [Populus trichocarpa]|uniref:Uncharacterized protein n=1 Tax=Populus trichocarpa TaxID=3694 RepID=A0ACC0RUX1_POPTR|nr:hypothetical protein POPTR_016G129250v4 [Populus trichocarpa]